MISNISKDKTMIDLSENYSKLFDVIEDVDIKWMLVSTALLMSEGLFKNDKAYDYVSETTIEEIEEKLFSFNRLMPGEKASTPYLLDSDNKAASPFKDFLLYGDMEPDNYDYLDDIVDITPEYIEYLKEEEKIFNLCHNLHLREGKYGCNNSIIIDGLLDVRKLIMRVRNSLAHSNFEILDENNIRLYHYNRKERKLDFNVILDTSTIINILDELNEIAYEKYSEFNDLYFSHNYIDYELATKKDVCDEDFINYIISFNLFDRETACVIYETATMSDIYKTISFNEKYLDDSYNVIYDNVNKMATIIEVMFNYIKPYCDFGIIINDIMYTDQKGSINSDELYVKYDIYSYLKSDFYRSNYSKMDENIYKQNYINLLIFSFLNCSLLVSHNEYENKNINYLELDFSSMNINESIMNKFLLKHINSNENMILNLTKSINDVDSLIKKKNDDILRKTDLLLTEYRDIKYFNEDLPKEINNISIEINELKDEKKNMLNTMTVILNNIIKYNYNQDFSNFVFRSLRNSLAHGNVRIYHDNDEMSSTVILFEDYEPSNKELTFRGEIKFVDLLKILTYENNIDEFYNININTSATKKR